MHEQVPASVDGGKVEFRISPEVAESIDAAAQQAGRSRNSFARQLLLDAIAKQISGERSCEVMALDALTRELLTQRSLLEAQGATLLRLAADYQIAGPEIKQRLRWLNEDLATALLLLLVHSGPLSLPEAQAVVRKQLHLE